MASDRCMAALTRVADDAGPSSADGAVVYRSRGVALVLGDGSDVLAAARELAGTLRVVAFAPGIEDAPGLPARVTAIGGRIVALDGHLGRFRAAAALPGGERRDMGAFSPNADGCFDVVLDLGGTPLIARDVGPPGYFAPCDAAGRDAALAAMATLVGTFGKPRFFAYDARLCTHGAKSVAGCTRCLDACDADALRSAGDTIAVDPALCQGCATCTLACPTGALSYASPSRGGLRQRIDAALATAAAAGAAHPRLVVHTPATAAAVAAAMPAAAQAIEVDALPAFGDELWLAALAAGARAVCLVDDGALPARARAVVARQVAHAQAILAAVGDDPRRVAWSAVGAWPDVAPVASTPASLAQAAGPTSKRQVAAAAIDGLARARGAVGTPPLAAGASFGDVIVDAAACTLCFACTNLCPPGALRIGAAAQPTLAFVEADCVQCGLCAAGCPEHVIRLAPRLSLDRSTRAAARTLAVDEMARCTACGTPFVSRRVLERSLQHMEGHPVLGQGGRERLLLCLDCRARAALDAG